MTMARRWVMGCGLGSLGLAAPGCGGAPVTKGAGAAGEVGAAVCDLTAPVVASESFPSWEALASDIGPGGPPEPCVPDGQTCYDEGPRHFVFASPGGPGSHDVVVEVAGGWRRYEALFDAGAGVGCGWDPAVQATTNPSYLVVRLQGESGFSEDGACRETGTLTQLALVDRVKGVVLATFMCERSPDAWLRPVIGETEAQDAVKIEACEGVTTTVPIAALAPCAAR